jgi:hypothetical protein
VKTVEITFVLSEALRLSASDRIATSLHNNSVSLRRNYYAAGQCDVSIRMEDSLYVPILELTILTSSDDDVETASISEKREAGKIPHPQLNGHWFTLREVSTQ